MSYVKADSILPKELLELLQEYADGQFLYIPRKTENRKSWGDNTSSKSFIRQRDMEIYEKYKRGTNSRVLADEYYLSEKSIQRIVLKEKKNDK